MRSLICIALCALLFPLRNYAKTTKIKASEPVVLLEKTFKLGLEAKEYYFGFEKGDEVVLDLEVLKGKPVKEVEFIEFKPGSTRYMEYKIGHIKGKRIKVNQKGIYLLRLKGGGLGSRVCRLHLERVPGPNSSPNFNSQITWKTRYDTTWKHYTKWVVIGQDTTYKTKQRKKLIRTDTSFIELIDRTERVHSQTNLSNSNSSRFVVQLPANKKSELQETSTISWAYWIGVGNSGRAAFEAEKKKFLQNQVAKAVGTVNPLAGMAVGLYTVSTNPPDGDNIHFTFTAYNNNGSRTIASGNSVTASGKVTSVLRGSFAVRLENDNFTNGINANVKIVVARERKTYEYDSYQVMKVEDIKEEQSFKKPIVKSVEFPVMGG